MFPLQVHGFCACSDACVCQHQHILPQHASQHSFVALPCLTLPLPHVLVQLLVVVQGEVWSSLCLDAIVAQHGHLKLGHVATFQCFIKHLVQRSVVVVDHAGTGRPAHYLHALLFKLGKHSVVNLVHVVIAQQWDHITLYGLDIGLVGCLAPATYHQRLQAPDSELGNAFHTLVDDGQVVLFFEPGIHHDVSGSLFGFLEVFALGGLSLPPTMCFVAHVPYRR